MGYSSITENLKNSDNSWFLRISTEKWTMKNSRNSTINYKNRNKFLKTTKQKRTRAFQNDLFTAPKDEYCSEMEEFLENGHVLCDPSSKEGKSCAWICNPGYSLVGPDHAKCTCDSALGCGWNGDVQFEPPICIKECWFIGVSY